MMIMQLLSFGCLFVFLQVIISSGSKLTIKDNGPVVFGSNLTFYAELNASDEHYEWDWTDNVDETTVRMSCGKTCNFTKPYVKTGKFTMNVIVKRLIFEIAKAKNEFEISEKIPGSLQVYQDGNLIPPKQSLSTLNETLLTTQLHDPSGILDGSLVYYSWTIQSESFSETGPNLSHVFSTAGDWNVLVVATAYVPHFTDYRSGTYSTVVKASNPITTVNISGDVILEHEKLLDLEVTCDGSGVFSYCWLPILGNGTDMENVSCSESEKLTTTTCSFNVIYYFLTTGHHQVFMNISNDVSSVSRYIDINIFKAVPEPQLSTVLIPVVCSLLAVAIVVVGVFYFVQSRHRFNIEVADFDFTASDSFVYRTFCEQLKDAFASSLPSRSAPLCERRWSFLDCRSEPEGEAENGNGCTEFDDDDDECLIRSDQLIEAAEE